MTKRDYIKVVTAEGNVIRMATCHIKYWIYSPRTKNTTVYFGGQDRLVVKGEIMEGAFYEPATATKVLDCTPIDDMEKTRPSGFNNPTML